MPDITKNVEALLRNVAQETFSELVMAGIVQPSELDHVPPVYMLMKALGNDRKLAAVIPPALRKLEIHIACSHKRPFQWDGMTYYTSLYPQAYRIDHALQILQMVEAENKRILNAGASNVEPVIVVSHRAFTKADGSQFQDSELTTDNIVRNAPLYRALAAYRRRKHQPIGRRRDANPENLLAVSYDPNLAKNVPSDGGASVQPSVMELSPSAATQSLTVDTSLVPETPASAPDEAPSQPVPPTPPAPPTPPTQ